jgi:hypothetical protein
MAKYYEIGDVVEFTPMEAARKYLDVIPVDEWPDVLEVKEWRTDVVDPSEWMPVFADKFESMWASLYGKYECPWEGKDWFHYAQEDELLEHVRIDWEEIKKINRQFVSQMAEKFKPFTCSHVATFEFHTHDGSISWGYVKVKLACDNLITVWRPYHREYTCNRTYDVELYSADYESGNWNRFCHHCGRKLGSEHIVDVSERWLTRREWI